MNTSRAFRSAWAGMLMWARPVTLIIMATLLTLQVAGPPSPAEAAPARASEPDTARIDAFVREQVQRNGIPGIALGLVEGDRIIHLQGFGKADGTGRAITPQTPFILASASKPLTAVAIMQLVEAGKVELDAPVQRYLRAFRVADPVASAQITVRHLLEHTSGLPGTACEARVDDASLEQFVAELQTVKLAHPVGALHDYCSGNYNVLGRIIETVSGRSYSEYMQQQIFAPLDMRHTFTSEQAAQQDGLAQTYSWFFGPTVPTPSYYKPSQVPSGYVMSSAEDMCHFLIAQLNQGHYGAASLLSSDGIAAMQAPGVPTPGGEMYGLGLVRGSIGGVPIIHHDGVHANTRTFLFFEPETGRGAVLLISSWGLLADSTFTEIEAGVARLLAGQEPAPASSLSVPTLYLIIDVVFAGLLALALWPLLRLRRWDQRLRQRREAGRRWRLRVGLRMGWEVILPLALLTGARLALDTLGAQSWYQGLTFLPDLLVWLWTICLVMLLTGILRAAIVIRARRRKTEARSVRVSASVS
jgi:CubicO group peptidase (beta-lactamase class C family)